MYKESIARRYSAALYSIASELGEVEAVTADLDGLLAALRTDVQLGEFFDSPVIQRDVKTLILQNTLGDRVRPLSLQFILLLVRKRREALLRFVAAQMHGLADVAASRQTAAVFSPSALSKAQELELARRLSSVYGRRIIPEENVDPQLLGGIVVQVGDRYVDA
ncbi:MAG: ATP synthase F1 subunit delta, partial [Candidatus Eremiobacteraeota bacterium]|nr:ATP synthase F1 subunit delta [Candidatus Eremiobacteraeota bacterium]